MSDYTPTLEDAKRTYAYIQGGLDHDEGYKPFYQVHEEAFDRMIAEVERKAAADALTDAVTEVEDLIDGYESTADEMRERGEWADSNRYSNYSAGLNMAVTKLLARAEAYRQERGEQ